MSSAIEIGNLRVGTTVRVSNSDGTSRRQWKDGAVNSADGIGIRYLIYNATDKPIKYISVEFLPYDTVGEITRCNTTGKDMHAVKLVGPFNVNEKAGFKEDVVWYNPTIKEVKIRKVHIEYMDGTEETINGEDLVDISDKKSVYYRKRGRKEGLRKCYMSFMVFFCLKEAKNDEDMKFHANQGLLLFILEVAGLVLSGAAGRLGTGVQLLITALLWGFAIAFSVRGIKDINNNRKREIPLLGKIRLIK